MLSTIRIPIGTGRHILLTKNIVVLVIVVAFLILLPCGYFFGTSSMESGSPLFKGSAAERPLASFAAPAVVPTQATVQSSSPTVIASVDVTTADALQHKRFAKLFRDNAGEFLKSGALYSVNYETRVMRASPLFWDRLKIDQKQGLLKTFFYACAEQGPASTVKALSDRNDTELGEYDDVWGPTIKE